MDRMDLDFLRKQHKMICEKIDLFLERLKQSKEPTEDLIEDFAQEIKLIIQLMEAHALCEEQIILPKLKEIYSSEAELLKYVVEDHNELNRGLEELIDAPLKTRKDRAKCKEVLNRIVVHFVEEERGLFPLMETFIKS